MCAYGRYGPFDSFSRHHIELAGPMDDHIRIVGCRYRPAGDSLMRENIFLDCLIDQHGNLVGSRVDDISGGDPLYYLQHILSHSFQPHGFHVFPVREQLHPHLAMAA
jgi:hypothetical protein